MKKIYKFGLIMFMLTRITSVGNCQTVFSAENFDALSNGDYVAQELSTHWDTWNSNPGTSEDGRVSNTYSNSSPNSMKIADNSDVVLYFKSDQTSFSSGSFLYRHEMYVPSGRGGYFNLMADYDNSGAMEDNTWAFEGHVNAMDVGASYIQYGYGGFLNIDSYVSLDTWMLWEIAVNLDTDEATLWIDGSEVVTWTWSDCGLLNLHIADYSIVNSPDYEVEAYFDDVEFEQLDEPDIPLSNWALYLSIVLIAAVFGWRIIRLYR
ncbi:MAG: hypothetical protein K9H13_12280 [Bacteroidales bacterium]|nr:hypothetical protein [Bacteroidales bacterium]MCF8345405.1 hypothetical protein [Bacteroidales bacterium]MCF8352517.1 hypothetical protein [Bacteroidales bacterium]